MERRRSVKRAAVLAGVAILVASGLAAGGWYFNARQDFPAGDPDGSGSVVPVAVTLIPTGRNIPIDGIRLATADRGRGEVSVYTRNDDGELTFEDSFSVADPNQVVDMAIDRFNTGTLHDLAVTVSRADTSDQLLVVFASAYATFSGSSNSYLVGEGPERVVAGRINTADSSSDLAVACADDDSINVFINNGYGGFSTRYTYSVGSRPSCIALGDFDSQTAGSDLVVAETGDDTLRVMLNTGNADPFYGCTQNAYGIDAGLHWVTVDDLDDDGYDDIIVTTGESSSDDSYGKVIVLLNDGTGAFPSSLRTEYTLGYAALRVAIDDFDEDGYPDVAATCIRDKPDGGCGTADEEGVAILLNDGAGDAGSLSSPEYYWTAQKTTGIAVGEIDDDSHLDVAVSASPTTASLDSLGVVSVFIGTGDGTLLGPDSRLQGAIIQSVVAADIVGGSDTDLILACSEQSAVQLLRGDGDGNFSADVLLYVGEGVMEAEVADMDNDGDLDVVASCRADIGHIRVRYNADSGEWGISDEIADAFGKPRYLTTADFDEDDYNDIAVAYTGVASQYYGGVGIWWGEGDSTQSWDDVESLIASYDVSVYDVQAGDIDNDGWLDLAAVGMNSGASTLWIFEGPITNTRGAQSTAAFPVDGSATYLSLGYLNSDSFLDVVLANQPGGAEGAISVFLANPTASWEELYDDGQTDYPTGSWPVWPKLADIDSDGTLDIVVLDHFGYGSFTVYYGEGDGTFGGRQTYGCLGCPEALEIADLDGDDRLDVVIGHEFEEGDVDEILIYTSGSGGGGRSFALGRPGHPVAQRPAAASSATPNPTSGDAAMSFTVPSPGAQVEISIYNAAGRLVRRISAGRLGSGDHTVHWDGRTDSGAASATGVYFCRIDVGGDSHEMKVTVVR